MKKLILVIIVLFNYSLLLAQLPTTQKISLFVIAPRNTFDVIKTEIEKKNSNWIVTTDRKNAIYVVKFNVSYIKTRYSANADIYKGSDIISSTGSVHGVFSSERSIIKKLIRQVF